MSRPAMFVALALLVLSVLVGYQSSQQIKENNQFLEQIQ